MIKPPLPWIQLPPAMMLAFALSVAPLPFMELLNWTMFVFGPAMNAKFAASPGR